MKIIFEMDKTEACNMLASLGCSVVILGDTRPDVKKLHEKLLTSYIKQLGEATPK